MTLVSPSAERKRAGFALGERLWVGTYGETFRASGAGRRDLHALIVEARIAREPGVASCLLEEAVPALRAVHHRAIVGTVAAVRDAGDLVVVTEEVPQSITLHEVLAACRARSVKIPQEVASAIGRALVDAAATMHAAGVVHGAIHPRSVLIDGDGQVRLGDLAIGRAVVTAVGHGGSADLLRGLSGFIAPELVTEVEDPTPACDVHAIGAVLFNLVSGELPPGSLHTTAAMERLIQRALDPELARRFASAVELQENLAEALEDDRWFTASAGELARFVARARKDDALDAETEDLLASLGTTGDPPTRDSIDMPEEPSQVTSPTGSSKLDSVLADLGGDDDDDESLTQVDPHAEAMRNATERDPISELLEIERAQGHEPEPMPEPSRSKKSGERARRIGAPPPAVVEPPEAATRPRIATPFDPGPGPDDASIPSLRGGKSRGIGQLVWLVIVLLAGAALVYVILRNQDQAKEDKAKQEAIDKQNAEKTQQLQAELPDPGTIAVTSTPDDGAVWLLLGHTPVDSFSLPTSMIHKLRVELEGYAPVDVAVGGKDWTGAGTSRRATFTVPLAAATPGAPPPKPEPDIPPEMAAELGRGLEKGSGFIHVETTPATGAAVWLLVGETSDMKLGGIEAGRDYELEVLKDGYTPGHITIKAEEWRDGGDPNLPLSAAPKHDTLTKHVDLVPVPPPAKKK